MLAQQAYGDLSSLNRILNARRTAVRPPEAELLYVNGTARTEAPLRHINRAY